MTVTSLTDMQLSNLKFFVLIQLHVLQKSSEHDPLHKMDALVVPMGLEDEVVYAKTTSLQVTSETLIVKVQL